MKWSYGFAPVPSVQLLSYVWLFVTPWTKCTRPPCPSPNQSLLKLMSIESVMSSDHLILCHPLLPCLQSFPASGSFLFFLLFFLYFYFILLFLNFIFTLFYFTILYWFCHTLTWIRHGCIWAPNPESPSHLPPHTIPLDHPRALAPSILYPASNLDWQFVSYMILYMFQCHSPKSSPSPSPTESKRVFYTSVSLLLFLIQGYHYHFSKFHIYALVKWQPTPVFLPRESQGRRSLMGCCLRGRTESDRTEAT